MIGDLLGDDVEAFSGSQANLEGAAENLFSSPPRPRPLHFESLRTPQTVLPTPGTSLQNKIESKLEKSLGNQFNIQLQQQMGVFQVSMLETTKSLREEMQSMKNASEAEVDKTSASTSKAGPDHTSKPSDIRSLGCSAYGNGLLYSPIMVPSTRIFSLDTRVLNPNTQNNLKGCVLLEPRNTRTKRYTRFRQNTNSQSSSSEEDQSSVPVKKSAKPQQAPSEQDQQKDNRDPVFYREVDMSDLPSQYAEEVETFRHIFYLPDARETMPRSSTTVLGLDDEKGQQEHRPRGPSAKSISQRCLGEI